MTILVLLLSLVARGGTDAYLRWAASLPARPHPVPEYAFLADVHARIAPLVAERPGVVQPEVIGHTVKGRPIWAFRVSRPGSPARHRLLVFANIHAMEWLGTEVATRFLVSIIRHPPPDLETWVVPVLNVDGRLMVEDDLRAGRNTYRRGNAHHVDLNRDFAVNREARAIWRHLIPAYYATSPAPLSQPESRAIDALADEQRFDAAVSLHAFGGFIYTPWAGRWARPDDRADLERLGHIMSRAQGRAPYQVKQLSHWAFFFRGQGMEIDHLYGEYGTRAFLIELSRSGLSLLRPGEWRDYFRRYNPHDPKKHVDNGFFALRALAAAAAPVSGIDN